MAREVFAYVDGAYLREHAEFIAGAKWPDPYPLVVRAANQAVMKGLVVEPAVVRRLSFYDAWRPADSELERYFRLIESQDDCHVRTGRERMGQRRGPRPSEPKGVRVLLAIEMLTDAYNMVFDVGLLVAGDADFVPLVDEVRRRGRTTVVVGIEGAIADDLLAAADRSVHLNLRGLSSMV